MEQRIRNNRYISSPSCTYPSSKRTMGITLTHFLSLIVMRCSFLDSIYSSFLPPSLSSSINWMRELFSNLETVSTDLGREFPDSWIVNAKLVAYAADQILHKLQHLLLSKDAAMASSLPFIFLSSSEIDDDINWIIRILEELLVSGEIKTCYSGVLAYINPGLSEQEVGQLLYSSNPSQGWSEKYKMLMKPSVLMDVPEPVNGFFNTIYNRWLRQASPFTLIISLHLSGLSGFIELPRLPVLHSLRISGCERLNAVSICEKLSAVEALEISCCPELTSLAGLNQLLSLRSLSLSFCFNLQFDLLVQLPPLLEYLDLTHCPSLEEWCQNAGLQNRKLDETIESFQRSSPVGDSPVYGRENEKNSIIEFLLSDDFNRSNLTVVCIVGESGIGKTSLAHLIYSEERVLDSFDARMFITMTEKSDETRLIKKLIESVTSSPCPMTEADLLEELLIDEMSGTKVFIVLDDADNENPCFWDKIVTILNHSTRGSVLLVTTESKDVAEVIGAMQTYYLGPLSDYYCWKIFCQHIFTGLSTNANTDLVETGKQLLSKCQHNPLCIKVLAGLFVCSKNEESWAEILKTDLWDMDGFDGDTLPTLRVGYELLPNELKKCLHYCSLFPKDYVFAKQQIVCMWMSQGFIFPVEGKQPEEVGLQNFDELLLRGFFQHSPLHDVEEDKFIMHDLICALATNLSWNECPPTKDAPERIFENCFHFSLNPSKIQIDKMKLLMKEASDLQSFVALTTSSFQIRINFSILDISRSRDLFTKCINLRTLDLSCTDIMELPSSVGLLRQLGYLGVSNTKIRSIPRELCSLVNLQTLEAKDCQHLVKLPETMMELKNLRHLDVSKKSGCVKMMIGIGQLTNLQSLAVFCVGCELPYCSIRELKDLNSLSSCLQIAGLENVTNGLDAKEAALHNKVHLNTLWLHWNDNRTSTESEESVTISEEVLNNLKPSPKIGELIIGNYRGNLFPTWMGDPSFTKLVSIILDKCLNCSQFPVLGGLPSLRHLSVQKLYHLVMLENTESQFVSKNTPKFPSLETLNLWEMYDLEELFETSDHDFPCLHTLSISRCPMLKSVPCFSSLLNLSLYCCVKLPHLPDFPSLKSLRIDGFQKIKSLEFPKDLPALKELEIRHCNELFLVEGLAKLTSLKKLIVVHCPNFGSLKNWKPRHSKPISTTRWFFPKEESTTQMEHQETSEPAEDGQIDLISNALTGCPATVQHSTVNSGLSIQCAQLVGTPPNEGYTWRKYGQKSINSSMSSLYYKCTYPDCPVKKKVQLADHYQIAEVVYKGIHTHARLPNRCNPGYSSVPEVNNSSTMDGSMSGLSVSKREREPSGEDTNDKQTRREIRTHTTVTVQTKRGGVDNLDDGFSWRKYGQKDILGSLYPRSYYRCTHRHTGGCQATKQVQRSCEDPTIFITTYVGIHNHQANASSTSSNFEDFQDIGDLYYPSEIGIPSEAGIVPGMYSAASAVTELEHSGTKSTGKQLYDTQEEELNELHVAKSDKPTTIPSTENRKIRTHTTVTSQTKIGVDNLDDGFSWRKYGQKDILGSLYPRGYYRCTHRHTGGCKATKQVQRSCEDPTIFITTYHGIHNHQANASSTSSNIQDFQYSAVSAVSELEHSGTKPTRKRLYDTEEEEIVSVTASAGTELEHSGTKLTRKRQVTASAGTELEHSGTKLTRKRLYDTEEEEVKELHAVKRDKPTTA